MTTDEQTPGHDQRLEQSFEAISGGKAIGFEPIGHDVHERIIEMRRQITDSRRG